MLVHRGSVVFCDVNHVEPHKLLHSSNTSRGRAIRIRAWWQGPSPCEAVHGWGKCSNTRRRWGWFSCSEYQASGIPGCYQLSCCQAFPAAPAVATVLPSPLQQQQLLSRSMISILWLSQVLMMPNRDHAPDGDDMVLMATEKRWTEQALVQRPGPCKTCCCCSSVLLLQRSCRISYNPSLPVGRGVYS